MEPVRIDNCYYMTVPKGTVFHDPKTGHELMTTIDMELHLIPTPIFGPKEALYTQEPLVPAYVYGAVCATERK